MQTMFMRPWILGALLLCVAHTGRAQMYGTGMMGGMQGCGYQQNIGDEAESIQDDISDRKEALRDTESEIKEQKAKLREAQRKMERARADLERRGIQSEFLSKIIDHVNEGRSCMEYDGRIGTSVSDNSEMDESRMPASETADVGTASSTTSVGNAPNDPGPYTRDEWARFCDKSKKGRVLTGVCDITRAQVPKGAYNGEICRRSIQGFQDSKTQVDQIEAKIEILTARKDTLKNEIANLKGDYKSAVRDHQKELREQMTEGGCVDCMLTGAGYTFQKPKTDWGGVVTNLGLGIASIYLGNNMQKYVAAQNARLGMPTQVYPSFGYGYPFIMGGISAALGMGGGGGGGFYGAIGGAMGQGAFGCANGIGGNGFGNMVGGPFGYPPGMFQTPWGGGMYTGFPMGGGMPMGLMGGGNFGLMAGGMPMGGMPMGGMPMGLMAGGNIGLMAGGMPMGGMPMGGMPMGGMPMGGMPMGLMAGGNIGLMAGGMPMGGMPMGGMPMGGMPMGGMPMGGMPMGGMPMGGMPMGLMAGGNFGLMAGGMPMGGMPMGGMPMGGMPMGGMGMDSTGMMQMQMQMQQQQMQMQMQQMNMYMQMQQRAQENYMNRQRVVMNLQSEMYSLMYRLQQAQMGVSTGGYLDFGGSYGGSFNPNTFTPGVPGAPGVPGYGGQVGPGTPMPSVPGTAPSSR